MVDDDLARFVGDVARVGACVSLALASRLVRQHLDDLGHDLELLLVRAGQDDRLEVRVDRLEADPSRMQSATSSGESPGSPDG
jgi:hypothetical protein